MDACLETEIQFKGLHKAKYEKGKRCFNFIIFNFNALTLKIDYVIFNENDNKDMNPDITKETNIQEGITVCFNYKIR